MKAKAVFLYILCLVVAVLPASAGGRHCHSHRCDHRCHGHRHHSNHHCDDEHCGPSCVANHYITVHVTNTVTQTVTNHAPTPMADVPFLDLPLTVGHVYQLQGFHRETPEWRGYGLLLPRSNHVARLVLPATAVRPVSFRLVDKTGATGVVMEPVPPVDNNVTTYLLLGRGRLWRLP